ncbi:hypothetical protein M9H77_09977 [Catharanthus roseus]|uniref:Uncharacterized protein n=1 Tax=Catharanthus roseus TaxID=4058 RepID=A0ACC0C241_CATRO|nr:hypothetical protein M9H77_09977 [Catharanthus roseus]
MKKRHYLDGMDWQKLLVYSSVFIVFCSKHHQLWINGYFKVSNVWRKLTPQITLNFSTRKMSLKIAIYNTLIYLITKTGLVISSVVVVLAIPSFGFRYIMEFTGAFLDINVSILFSYLCYLKIHKGYKNLGRICWNYWNLSFWCFYFYNKN